MQRARERGQSGVNDRNERYSLNIYFLSCSLAHRHHHHQHALLLISIAHSSQINRITSDYRRGCNFARRDVIHTAISCSWLRIFHCLSIIAPSLSLVYVTFHTHTHTHTYLFSLVESQEHHWMVCAATAAWMSEEEKFNIKKQCSKKQRDIEQLDGRNKKRESY